MSFHKNAALPQEAYLGEKIKELLLKTEVSFDDEKVQKLAALVVLLCKWNKALNLTSIKDPDDMVVLHILDSAVISPLLTGKNIADVGTGAGFPGLVLAILNPDKHFTLIDSVAKKLSFVKSASVSLKLENVTLINDRCENINPEIPFDCIVSRAFAPLARMVDWCSHLLDDKGVFIAMKANLEDEEIKELPLFVKIKKIEELKVPTLNAERKAVFIEKAE